MEFVRWSLVFATVFSLLACGSSRTPDSGADAPSDAETDAPADTGSSDALDEGATTGDQGSPEQGVDLGVPDVGPADAGTDLGSDAGTDLGSDAGTDLGSDAGADLGSDPGCACDDGIACTIDTCRADGTCQHRPYASACPDAGYCSATAGCVEPDVCASDMDCPRPDFCTMSHCNPSTRTCAYATLDGDGDGIPPIVCGGTDCDDARAATHPGASEACNLIDDDCNGVVDGVAADHACTNGYRCRGGACACPSPLLVCRPFFSLVCVDPTSDPHNCGACGFQCPDRAECADSACRCSASTDTTCPSSVTQAGFVCVDLTSDVTHCGACDRACAGFGVCTSGTCTCPPNVPTLCATSNRCVDLTTDVMNCGTCDHVCPVSATCQGGVCSSEPDWATGYYTATGGTQILASGTQRIAAAGDHVFFFTDTPSGSLSDTSMPLVSWGARKPVLASLDAATGATRWILQTTPSITVKDLIADGAGDVHVVGSRPSTGTGSVAVIQRRGAIDGTVAHEQTIAGAPADVDVATAVAVEPSGNLVVVGMAHGSPDLGGGPLPPTMDGFVYRYAPDGGFLAAWRVPGTPQDVAVTASGNIAVLSAFSGSVTVGTDTFTAAPSSGDWFVAVFAPTGALVGDFCPHAMLRDLVAVGNDVVVREGGNGSTPLVRFKIDGSVVSSLPASSASLVTALASDGTSVYIGIYYAGGSTVGGAFLQGGYIGYYVAKVDPSGTTITLISWIRDGFALATNITMRVAPGATGHVLASTYFNSQLSFDVGPTPYLNVSGGGATLISFVMH